MVAKFFGQYLLDKNLITQEHLVRAVNFQKHSNLSIGEYAVKLNLLTKNDVNKILIYQKNSEKRFGDLAVEHDLLTEDQVQELLVIQKKEHIFIGQALVAIGVMDQKDLEQMLECYANDQRVEEEGKLHIPDTMPNAKIFESMFEYTCRYLMRMSQIFIKKDHWLQGIVDENLPFAASITFSDGFSCIYTLCTSEEFALVAAKNIIEEPNLKPNDQIVIDNLAEIVNIICGGLATKLDGQGIGSNISTPIMYSPALKRQIRFDARDNHINFFYNSPYDAVVLSIQY